MKTSLKSIVSRSFWKTYLTDLSYHRSMYFVLAVVITIMSFFCTIQTAFFFALGWIMNDPFNYLVLYYTPTTCLPQPMTTTIIDVN